MQPNVTTAVTIATMIERIRPLLFIQVSSGPGRGRAPGRVLVR